MRHLVRQPHMILSVENSPYPDKVDTRLSHDDAVQFLKQFQGGKIYSIDGHYGKPEKSILITDPSDEQKEAARALAHMTGQESHIESDGYTHKMIYNHGPDSGKVVMGQGTKFHEAKPSDYYSTLPDGSTFTHNFNFEDSQIQKAREEEGVSPENKKVFRKERRKFSGDTLASQVTSSPGVSKTGIEARRADKKKPGTISHGYARVSDPDFHAKRAKTYAKQSLQDLRSQPKPKLTKASFLSAPKVKLNPEHGKKIADAYHSMKHDPNHPEVKAAYGALIDETKKQFKDMLDQGFKFSKIKGDNPYKTSKDLHADLKQNKHLYFFPTESGFGSGGQQTSDHPMLQPTEFMHEGKPLLANDLFRIVHDYRGHHLGGESGFGPIGEHQAYLTHKKDFSPLAQKALASETMGQNSWVNFGPHGEENRKNPANTVYADQKAGLLPDEIINGKWHE